MSTTSPAVEVRTISVDIVVPVHNEEAILEASVRRLHEYLHRTFPFPWRVTIADNASTDGTWALATRLAGELSWVRAVRIDRKGRGRALRAAWSASDATVVAYMDVDLSTDLDALLPLVAPLLSGHSDVAIGTRLAAGARVVRGPKRELISRAYNLLLRAALHSSFSDAQCGFKAVRADAARRLLPLVEDDGWFFDTELLVLAERNGMRIHEVPVDWIDDPDSRVDVVSTARGDLAGIVRMLGRIATGRASLAAPARTDDDALPAQLARFAAVGAVSTAFFAVLVTLLARPLGLLAADIVALGACSLGNTAANRRLTFSLQGRAERARHLTAGLALAALPLGLTLVALTVLALAGVTSLAAQVVVLTAASAGAAVLRFGLLRRWVFA